LLQDKVENYKGNIIQHGYHNDRIYLMRLSSLPTKTLPHELIDWAKLTGYSKIFVKVPESAAEDFFNAGFIKEAVIPAFYLGSEKAIFLGYYLTKERQKEADVEKIDNILSIALGKSSVCEASCLDNRFTIRKCLETDVSTMAKIYKTIFPSYPFPIYDPDYLLKTMKSHVEYFGIETNDKLVAISSAEIDDRGANAEMTDFATLPDWRGNSFACHLLAQMEEEIRKKNIKTAYTIARSMSLGMNISFSKSEYKYSGRLKNNTNISGRIESMNVWYKLL